MKVLETLAFWCVRLDRKTSSNLDLLLRQFKTTRPAEVSDTMLRALVVAEDRRFWWHIGVDPMAVLRATLSTLLFGKPEGGSTIQQQLVRTVTLDRERTFGRKTREMLLALALSRYIDRETVLRLYLTLGYFGARANGVTECCRRIGVSPFTKSAWESASIIARLRYPEPEVLSETRTELINRRTAHIARLLEPRSALRLPSRGGKPAVQRD